MDKNTNVISFLDDISVKWFKETFSDKLLEIKKSILEIPEDAGESLGIQPFDVKYINLNIAEVIDNLGSIVNMSDIKTFTKKYSLNSIKLSKENLAETNMVYKSESELTTIILNAQISNSLVEMNDAFEATTSLKNKLGGETLVKDVDLSDFEYILINSLEKEVTALNEWSVKMPMFSNKIAEDLKIINESQSVLEIAEASHSIEHVFINVISDFLNDDQHQGLLDENKEMLHQVTYGTRISELILTKSSFCEYLYNSFKKILSN